MNVRYAIDARWYGAAASGVATYAHTLLLGLVEVVPGERITVITNRRGALPPEIASHAAFQWIELPGNPMSIRHQRLMPRIARDLNIACLHSIDLHAPLAGRFRKVITCHDLIPLVLPHRVAGGAKARYKAVWRLWVQLQLAQADRVIAISQCSQRDIIEKIHLPAERISVVPAALYRPASNQPAHAERVERDPRLEFLQPMILSVGRRAPYKNLSGLLRGFHELIKSCSVDARLVITGALDRRYPEPEQLAERLGIAERVIFTGYLSDASLHDLYQRARMFVCPSLYEGFGLPVLEAMAAGIPVICSNRASLPEVCGNAAIMIDPENPAEMARAMQQILTDGEMANRLAELGRRRAAEFTPRRMAEALLPIYRSLV